MTRRWMSCARSVDWHTSRHRHLVTTSTRRWDRGWADTLCGATGTPGSFRPNYSKPPCPSCCEQAGIGVPNQPGLEQSSREGSAMPRTATKSDVSKRSREVKASPILTDEDIKVAARRTASRAAKKGEDWTAAYIKAWRRMSGMKNRPAGPVA